MLAGDNGKVLIVAGSGLGDAADDHRLTVAPVDHIAAFPVLIGEEQGNSGPFLILLATVTLTELSFFFEAATLLPHVGSKRTTFSV